MRFSHSYGSGGLFPKLCPNLRPPWTSSLPGSSVIRFSKQGYWSGFYSSLLTAIGLNQRISFGFPRQLIEIPGSLSNPILLCTVEKLETEKDDCTKCNEVGREEHCLS